VADNRTSRAVAHRRSSSVLHPDHAGELGGGDVVLHPDHAEDLGGGDVVLHPGTAGGRYLRRRWEGVVWPRCSKLCTAEAAWERGARKLSAARHAVCCEEQQGC
jgi:hypothetical protein